MANIVCAVHGFPHASAKNSDFSEIYDNYTHYLIKFTIGGVARYGRLRAYLVLNDDNQYALEMSEECPDGFNKTDYEVFTCIDRRGVVIMPDASMCLIDGKHSTLNALSNKMVDETSVCCINILSTLKLWPTLTIGGKCILPRGPFKSYNGICKWIGTINNIECVGVEMKNWIWSDCNGYCLGLKIFDCRDGHGVLLRASDIEIEKLNPENLEFHQNGFVDLKNIYHAEKNDYNIKERLRIGRRVEVLLSGNMYCETSTVNAIFGEIKWIGTINNGICVGLELDYNCEGAMDGFISCSESFDCEPGYGAICPIKLVTFDYYVYSVEFTVAETFTIDSKLIHKEDWNQKIVKEKDLRINSNCFVYIEKNSRIFNINGLLRWCGFIQGVSVGILEMDDNFPITRQQKITQILTDARPMPHIVVHTQYLFKYRALKSYQRTEEDIIDFNIGNRTSYGTVKWRGVDGNYHLYYGFEMESSSDGDTHDTVRGQSTLQYRDGSLVLISSKKIYETINSSTIKSGGIHVDSRPAVSDANLEGLVTLLTTIATKAGMTSKDILSTAMEMDNKDVLGPLLNNMSSFINIYKRPDIVSQLLESQCFDTLEICVDKCPIDADNNKQLLRVAAQSLTHGRSKLFEKCMNKCTDKDTLMENGETLITHIIKERVDQSLIIEAIEGYELDLTKTNNDKVNPLSLACDNSMVDVVGCIIGHFKSNEKGKKVCSICMDREISTVFNCGHNSCKECSESIIICHICKGKITSRGLLYLN